MARRVFIDTEWTAPPWSDRAELMWIGLADEEGRSWYGISSEVERVHAEWNRTLFNLICTAQQW